MLVRLASRNKYGISFESLYLPFEKVADSLHSMGKSFIFGSSEEAEAGGLNLLAPT